MTPTPSFGIVSKADSAHYEGLVALLASIQRNAACLPIEILDCGLTSAQRRHIHALGASIKTVSVAGYEIRRASDQGKFSEAIYGLLEAEMPPWDVTIALDADTIVLGDLTEIALAAQRSGLAAATDHPTLDIRHQIGDEGALSEVLAIMPSLPLDAAAFNAGVLGYRNDYFLNRLLPAAKRLKHLHAKLWGNDQAILNLAACEANPSRPFERLERKYNARPRYRRAPETPPLQPTFSNRGPGLLHAGLPIHVLHFVGHPKPWMAGYSEDCPGLSVWRAYREFALEAS